MQSNDDMLEMGGVIRKTLVSSGCTIDTVGEYLTTGDDNGRATETNNNTININNKNSSNQNNYNCNNSSINSTSFSVSVGTLRGGNGSGGVIGVAEVDTRSNRSSTVPSTSLGRDLFSSGTPTTTITTTSTNPNSNSTASLYHVYEESYARSYALLLES
ncbi:hypothetical protein HK100_007857, partial [Physocladia obscura]